MGQSLSINEIQKIKLSSKKTPTARKESNSTKLKKLVNQFDVSISNSTACNFLAFCGHNSEKVTNI